MPFPYRIQFAWNVYVKIKTAKGQSLQGYYTLYPPHLRGLKSETSAELVQTRTQIIQAAANAAVHNTVARTDDQATENVGINHKADVIGTNR